MRETGRLYALTGVHKSGNSWLARLLTDFPQVTRAPLGVPPRLDFIARIADEYLRRTGVVLHAEYLARRLYDPADLPELEDVDAAALKESLRPLASSLKFSLAKADRHAELCVGALIESLFARLTKSGPHEGEAGVCHVAPSKHLPLDRLRERFPGSRVIWIQRDPRDVLISWLYHDLGVLSYDKMLWFCHESWWDRRAGRVRLRSDWLKQALGARAEAVCRFYRESLPFVNVAGTAHCLIVRYERLLDDFEAEFGKVLDFLEIAATREEVTRIKERFSFRAITGGELEIKNAHVRKGQAGDWRNYFDAGWPKLLPADFLALVRELGYEDSQGWLDALPAQAPLTFDLSRFRIHESATKTFSERWLADDNLQKAFPHACTDFGADSFFDWLQRSSDAGVRRWFRVAETLAERWNARAHANKVRHPADMLMGY